MAKARSRGEIRKEVRSLLGGLCQEEVYVVSTPEPDSSLVEVYVNQKEAKLAAKEVNGYVTKVPLYYMKGEL